MLTLWTDDPVLAARADRAGVDRVGLDLETLGKRERQAGLGTWISEHRLESLPALRTALSSARLFARLNPLNPGTAAELEAVIAAGVEVVMLPMFRSAGEVEQFVRLLHGRATLVLLLETVEAAAAISEIAAVEGVDEVHIGINDLAIGLGLRNRFEVLDSEIAVEVGRQVRSAGLPFGIGGIGRVDDQALPIPPDLIYAQYPRLGATMALLSRAFTSSAGPPLEREVPPARARLAEWFAASPDELDAARLALREETGRCRSW